MPYLFGDGFFSAKKLIEAALFDLFQQCGSDVHMRVYGGFS
jgi:hypothetical protein